MAATPNKLERLLARAMPQTLGMRVALTGGLLAALAVAATVAIVSWLRSPAASFYGPGVVLVPILIVGVVALLLGGLLIELMRKPIEVLIDRVKEQAGLAESGSPAVEPEVLADPLLPVEFRELSDVVQRLITSQRERQDALEQAVRHTRSAEETLGVVVSESPEVQIVIQDGRILLANPAAALALGLPSSQLADLTLDEAMHGLEIRDEADTRYTADSLLERALKESVRVSVTEPGRTLRWYVFVALRHTQDVRNRILLTGRDVTEELRLEAVRAQIVSLVGHDLRSPLTVVMGYLDLMTRDMSPEERARAIDAARRNAARMADLLEDLLSATKAQELLAVSELAPTPLVPLAEEVVASLGPTHAERKLLLEPECDPVALGEEKRLRQVFVNLITNAYKYSPDDAPITVRITCDDHDAFVSVIDHGPGIPEGERDRVFARFERLENGIGRPGVGLGLYIVNIIANNHGGSVHIEETPGGGATFVVQLPLAGTMRDGEIVLNEK